MTELSDNNTEILKKLERLCDVEVTSTKWLYWPTEIYGLGSEIRNLGYYPQSWPLNIYSSHGVSLDEIPAPHELNSQAPVIVYNSKRLVNQFGKLSSKPCYCIISPFVHYRRRKKITRSNNATGTIVFVGHSTPDIDDLSDVQNYISQLKDLPKKYKPITTCLHFHDINKGLHKFFLQQGFTVVTVGNPSRKDFVKRC